MARAGRHMHKGPILLLKPVYQAFINKYPQNSNKLPYFNIKTHSYEYINYVANYFQLAANITNKVGIITIFGGVLFRE
jgi:hypothetical protein